MTTAPQPELAIATRLPRHLDVLVVGLGDGGLREVPAAYEQAFTKRFGTSVAAMAAEVGASPKPGGRRTLPAPDGGPRLLVVGLGPGEPSGEDLRRAAATGVRQAESLAGEGSISVALSFGTVSAEEASAVAEGALLGTYRFDPLKADGGGRTGEGKLATITVLHAGGAPAELTRSAQAVAGAVNTARTWVNLPPNLLYPETFADAARELVKDAKISVDVLDEKALAKGGYGGLLAVGGGSARPPRLVRLSYAPRGAKTHLALIGKGITFDTGGLDIKPPEAMLTMKCDMAGAAAVITATHAVAQLGLKVQVTAYAAMAENMPSGAAYRPSDVIRIYGGKTVENGNSDAEGRIVMADALARSAEDAPDVVVDVATLTGACVIALGDRTAGLMSNDDELADRILDAAETAGEDFWQLPIPRHLRDRLKSEVADIRSVSSDRKAGALIAATFLRDFIPEGRAWAHMDIAGPAFHEGAGYGYVTPGGTGFGVRTLVELARSLAG